MLMIGPFGAWEILIIFALVAIVALPVVIIYLLLRMKTAKTMIIEPKFKSEARRLLEMGYQIVDANSERILLEKRQRLPRTFAIVVWLLLGPIGWFLLGFNLVMRYHLRVCAELWDVNGKIELRT